MNWFKIISLVLTIFFTVSTLGYSQSKVRDLEVVMNEINDADSPEEKCAIAHKEGHRYFMNMKRVESLEVLTVGLEIAKKHELKERIIPLLLYMGTLYESFDSLEAAIHYAEQARKNLSDDTSKFKGRVYSFLGRHYQYSGKLDSMLKYYTLAEEWYTENEPYQNWALYERWHDLYIESQDYEKALEFLDKAYTITKPKGSIMDHGLILYRYRKLASRNGDMKLFAKYTKEYYELTKHKKGGITAHGYDLGEGLTIKEKIKRYEELFLANERLAFDMGNKAYFSTMSNLLLEDGQLDRARSYWAKIDTTDQSLQDRMDMEKLGVTIYERLGNNALAFEHLRKENILQEMLRGKEKLRQIEEFNVQYETIQKEKKVALLESEAKVKTLELQRANRGRMILLVGLLGALFFASGMAYLFAQNRKKKLELESKNGIIEGALKEKNILLREIHHRVKNNLQVISSILNLQSNYISDDVALEAINEGKNRVSSMALIHQNLYQDDNVTHINAKEYFTELISSLYDSYEISEGEVELTLEVDDLSIDVDTMIPLGLVTNELVSNALKHAFTHDPGQKKLRVELNEVDGKIVLRVKDNGKGTTMQEFTSSKSFGNKLIQAFRQKLKAELNVKKEAGTEILFEISNYNQVA